MIGCGTGCFQRQPLAGTVPQLHAAVFARRGQAVALGGESHGPDRAGMPLELSFRVAGSYVPDSNRAVLAARSQPFAVGCEGDRFDESAVAAERGVDSAGTDAPDDG